MKNLIKLLLFAFLSISVLIACDDDDSNPTDNGNDSDAPLSCNISGDVNMFFEANNLVYQNVPDEDVIIRTLTATMVYEGNGHTMNIVLRDPNGNFQKSYQLGEEDGQAVCYFLYGQGSGLPFINYVVDISGRVDFSVLTDTKAVGTFNFVAETVDGSKSITVTNGKINKK